MYVLCFTSYETSYILLGMHRILNYAEAEYSASALCRSHICVMFYVLNYVLHFMSYALDLMFYVLRLTFYALRFTSYTLRLTFHALRLRSMSYISCERFTFYVLRLRFYALCLCSTFFVSALCYTSYVLRLTFYVLCYAYSFCVLRLTSYILRLTFHAFIYVLRLSSCEYVLRLIILRFTSYNLTFYVLHLMFASCFTSYILHLTFYVSRLTFYFYEILISQSLKNTPGGITFWTHVQAMQDHIQSLN